MGNQNRLRACVLNDCYCCASALPHPLKLFRKRDDKQGDSFLESLHFTFSPRVSVDELALLTKDYIYAQGQALTAMGPRKPCCCICWAIIRFSSEHGRGLQAKT